MLELLVSQDAAAMLPVSRQPDKQKIVNMRNTRPSVRKLPGGACRDLSRLMKRIRTQIDVLMSIPHDHQDSHLTTGNDNNRWSMRWHRRRLTALSLSAHRLGAAGSANRATTLSQAQRGIELFLHYARQYINIEVCLPPILILLTRAHREHLQS